MANYRRGRINDEMLKEVAMILREVKDPRVQRAFVSVTAAEVTPDLKYAKIYYSFLGKDDPKEVAKGLKAASGFIRGQIAKRMNLRITPELSFFPDNSIKHGAHIATLLEGITFSDDVDDSSSENTDE
ncbi:MAG: 30S ribosome-binding factor RbfA [Clostridia bacterium]|nr:30S ribosome-binding factor RbfA [Clostridia bacterium]